MSKDIILNPLQILEMVLIFLVVNHTFMRHVTNIGNLNPIDINVQLLVLTLVVVIMMQSHKKQYWSIVKAKCHFADFFEKWSNVEK